MFILQLTQEEKNNLINLLGRIEIKGNEAFVFCNLVQKIQNTKNFEQPEIINEIKEAKNEL